MPYITTSNALRVLREIDINKVEVSGKLYKRDIKIFSQKDVKRFLILNQLYSKPAEFLLFKYERISVVDTFQYVYEGGQPAYHLHLDCSKLNSTFNNFKIPREIQSAGSAKVQEFRQWFTQNRHLTDRPDVFIMKLKLKYGNLITEEISYDNSGVTDIDNMKLEELEQAIDELLDEITKFYNQGIDAVKYVIDKFVKSTSVAYTDGTLKNNNSGYTDAAVKRFLVKFDKKFKQPLKRLLETYYRVSANSEINLEGDLLEQLGFRKCGECYSVKQPMEPNK
jgi:hypothetical protein